MTKPIKDVFLSHASEDTERYVRPFAKELSGRGITYWLDEAEIGWGDKISEKINHGLANARFVIVFLSKDFLRKNWPQSEMNAAISKENSDGETILLPLVIDDIHIIFTRYPLLRDKVYVKWTMPVASMVDQLERILHHKRRPQENAQAQDWDTEPTVRDILGPMKGDDPFWNRLGYFVRTHRDLLGDTPVCDAIEVLPPEFHVPIMKLVEQYRTKIEGIRAAIAQEPPSDGSFEVVSLLSTPEAELDVMLRNLGENTICITRFTIRLLRNRYEFYAGPLRPSAKYKIPCGALSVGEAKALNVSHVIEPHKADRFLIALGDGEHRGRYYRVTLSYNKNWAISENVWL